MKKINKILLIFISYIIIFLIGVNASNGYKAEEIYYKPSSGTIASSSVNEALNELYPIKTELTNLKEIGTAKSSNILAGLSAVVKGDKIDGTMIDNGAISKTLSSGGSYTIPAGYHNGSGKITVNSLASQTSSTAVAGDILSGKTAFVNGNLVTGSISTYTGATSITPSSTTQTLNTAGKYLSNNITIGTSSRITSLTEMKASYNEGSGDRSVSCSATIPAGYGWMTLSTWGWGCGSSYVSGTGTCYNSARTRICFGYASSSTNVSASAYAQSCNSNQTASCSIFRVNY